MTAGPDLFTDPKHWSLLPWVGFDLETTSTDPMEARIVSAALVVVNSCNQTVKAKHWLVDPGVEIPAEATEVHGITTDQVQGCPTPAEVLPAMVAGLERTVEKGWPVVIMNARYDWPVLYNAMERHQILPQGRLITAAMLLDPLVLDRKLDKYRKGRRTLESMCPVYEVPVAQAHDAAEDAVVAVKVTRAIVWRYPSIQQLDLAELQHVQGVWFAEWRDGINAHWRKEGKVDEAGQLKQVEGVWPR